MSNQRRGFIYTMSLSKTPSLAQFSFETCRRAPRPRAHGRGAHVESLTTERLRSKGHVESLEAEWYLDQATQGRLTLQVYLYKKLYGEHGKYNYLLE